jgi:hypothetical protein
MVLEWFNLVGERFYSIIYAVAGQMNCIEIVGKVRGLCLVCGAWCVRCVQTGLCLKETRTPRRTLTHPHVTLFACSRLIHTLVFFLAGTCSKIRRTCRAL